MQYIMSELCKRTKRGGVWYSGFLQLLRIYQIIVWTSLLPSLAAL